MAGFAFCFCFLFIFNDICQTNYLKIYRSYLRQILRVGRTMAARDQSEISSFPSLEVRCHHNQFCGRHQQNPALATQLSF